MWINAQGGLYGGDMAAGDRAATAEEIAAWEIARNAALPTQIAQAKATALDQRRLEDARKTLGKGTTAERLNAIETILALKEV